jgi:CheY-like chemotaxis protein
MINNVLIVDDNHKNRMILEENFKFWGIKSESCSSAKEALNKLNNTYDVMIIDYHMPEIDGLDLIKTIRKNQSLEKQPIIFLHSSNSNPQLIDECNKLNVKFKLIKPVKNTELLQYLDNINTFTDLEIENKTNTYTTKKSFSEEVLRILIVEDVKINMMLTKNILNKNIPNAIILEAYNGQEAVEMFEKHAIDLILMDLQMPVMDGIEATIKIREIDKKLNKKPIITALTAAAVQEVKEKCKIAGMDDYITKPIDIDHLKNILNSSLKKVFMKNENNSDNNEITNLQIFNIDKALAKYNNDEDFVKEMILMTREELKLHLNQLENEIRNNNFKQIKFEIHAIKGIARVILLEKLNKNCEDIEKSMQENDNFSEYFTTIKNDIEQINKISF